MAEVTSHPPGAFCWIELGTSDQKAAKDFYTRLFGWSFTDNDMGPMTYTTFTLKGRDVAACYALDAAKMPGVPPHWMLYVATTDADASARRTAELGGKAMAPAFDVMDLGRMAVLTDPQGGSFSVWQAKSNKGIGIHNEPLRRLRGSSGRGLCDLPRIIHPGPGVTRFWRLTGNTPGRTLRERNFGGRDGREKTEKEIPRDGEVFK